MIAKHNRFGCLNYSSFPLCDALGPTASPPKADSSADRFWNETLGEMLRSMSEFLMLASSRSPIQWMIGEPSADLRANGGGHQRARRSRARRLTAQVGS